MESFTKVKLDERQLEMLVHTAFAADLTIVSCTELTGGFYNTAYDLLLSDGRSVILKVAPSEETQTLSYEKDIMRAEVEALRLVAAGGNVPVPAVYSFDESRSLIPCPYFFMEKVGGQPYSEVKDSYSAGQRAAVEAELGRYQRLINEITGPEFGLFKQDIVVASASWRDTFTAMMSTLLADARNLDADLPATEEEIRQELEHYLPALDEVTEPRLIHWDLWNGNLFVKDGVIVSIIDWERALWGDVLMEYYFRHFENSQAFFQGYGQIFDSPNELLRKKLYDFYLDLILVIECYSRQYKDDNHVRWAAENLAESWKSFKHINASKV
ncbi:phosphotransferase family protein [Paenibacillus tianjinensis]|uniref:Aminoglycoside phosphotransferase family protein n=1 Tax=Paenibacillus tianjinensis TaxID=2810347 RepID=A0ABX7LJI5_9BACL|nr:aminoglycoside phosphotransferase family protein [Paenibacillus tianjinensis]QSF47149.1 aminoglycoside phosphotransferase family protein [Paenibacillus tianjinensis]